LGFLFVLVVLLAFWRLALDGGLFHLTDSLSGSAKTSIALGMLAGILVAAFRYTEIPKLKVNEDRNHRQKSSTNNDENRGSIVKGHKPASEVVDCRRSSHNSEEENQESVPLGFRRLAESDLEVSRSYAKKDTHDGVERNITECRGEQENPKWEIQAGREKYRSAENRRAEFVVDQVLEDFPTALAHSLDLMTLIQNARHQRVNRENVSAS
jgi:hypothetical protein